jgi:hypothetical protein
MMVTISDPHARQPMLRSGPSPKDARLVALMLHGRGASAEDILGLAEHFSAGDIAYVAPPGHVNATRRTREDPRTLTWR